MRVYVLQVGRHRLHLGETVGALAPAVRGPEPQNEGWDLPRQPLTARQIVEELDVLFEAVCQRLGAGAAERRILLESMAATVAIDRRESSLPLKALDFADPLRRELTAQAERIGGALAAWGVEINSARAALDRFGPDRLRQIELRSHCDGHLWTPEATAVLTGATGGPVVMQLYNEWLHQLVLLRDALLPFENWTDPAISLQRHSGARGLRGLETARGVFLGEFLTRILTHGAIVRFARSLFEPEEARVGEPGGESYGFQTENGLVLPSVIGREDVAAGSKGLLSWHAARVLAVPANRTVGFRYGLADYLAAPRSAIGPARGEAPPSGDARIVTELTGEGAAVMWLELSAGERSYRVDLGQCLRGQRFAYQPQSGGAGTPADVQTHRAEAILVQPGLVTAEEGTHVLPTGGNALLTLALLGKIYPENSVLGEAAHWSEVVAAGKSYGAKFILGTPVS